MTGTLASVGAWLRRRAENVIAVLLGVMFCAFVLQILFRYFFNLPTGWSTELTVVTWLWMVLFGASFVLKDSEEIRFDLLYSSVRPRTRRVMVAIVAVAIIALYLWSLPASWSYVTFMKVEKSSYLKIRLDLLYSIYIVFLVAIVCRYGWLLWQALTGRDAVEPNPAIDEAAP